MHRARPMRNQARSIVEAGPATAAHASAKHQENRAEDPVEDQRRCEELALAPTNPELAVLHLGEQPGYIIQKKPDRGWQRDARRPSPCRAADESAG